MVLNEYKCGWCGTLFKQRVFYSSDGKTPLSTQVKCTNCLNFIPTWEVEETGSLTSAKHYHKGRVGKEKKEKGK